MKLKKKTYLHGVIIKYDQVLLKGTSLYYTGSCLGPQDIKVGLALEKGLAISYLLPIYDKISLNYCLRDYCLDCLKLITHLVTGTKFMSSSKDIAWFSDVRGRSRSFSRRGREAKRTANDLGRLRIRLQKILFFYLENGLRIFQNLLLYDRAEFLSPGPTVKAETKLMASLS